MKKIIFITVLLFIPFLWSHAQKHKQCNKHNAKYERIEANRIAYITKQLSLSPKEAQLFWPLYNELEQKQDSLHNIKRGLMSQIKKNINKSSDKEIAIIADKLINLRVEEAELSKSYHHKFKNVLNNKKVLQLYIAERQFHRYLLHQIRERRKR